MDKDICPYQSTLRHKYAETDDWDKLNKKYQDVLFKEMIEKWNANKTTLDFTTAYPYIDYYYSSWFDQMDTNELSPTGQAQVDEILRDGLYEGFYGLDLAVRLATSRFFNFIHSTLDKKIEAVSGSANATEFYKNVKFMYLSAHDSTLSAIMSGLYQKQPEQVKFASNFKIELYQTASGNFTVRMMYNEDKFLIGTNNTCAQFDCPYSTVKTFLKSREYDGDIEDICVNGEGGGSSGSKTWLIILLIVAILIVVLIIGYFVVRYFKNKKGSHEMLIEQEDTENMKPVLNKSIPNSTRMVSEDSD